MHAAPELPLGGAVAASLLRLPQAPVALVALGLVALFVALAGALSDRLAAATPARAPAMWAVIVVVAAVIAALRPVDPWAVWAGGLGLAGAAIAAPRLAAGKGAGKCFGLAVEAIGAFVGGAAFVALVVRAASCRRSWLRSDVSGARRRAGGLARVRVARARGDKPIDLLARADAVHQGLIQPTPSSG